MGKVKNDIEFSLAAQKEFEGIEKGLGQVSQKITAEEKARDGCLVISDKKGGIIKVPAKDL